MVGVSHHTVEDVRQEMEASQSTASGQSAQSTASPKRVGADGRTTRVKTKNKSTQRSAKTLKKQIDNFIAEWPNLNENQKTAFVKEYKDELAELLEWVEASGEEVEDEAAQREGAVA